jgi:hypothetical protein
MSCTGSIEARQSAQKVLGAMWSRLDLKKRDVFLFLGSFRGHQHNFGLMDSYSPEKQRQGELFG